MRGGPPTPSHSPTPHPNLAHLRPPTHTPDPPPPPRYKKIKKQCEANPPCHMGGFTRLLHSGKEDDLMAEIPTFVADPLPPEHPDHGWVWCCVSLISLDSVVVGVIGWAGLCWGGGRPDDARDPHLCGHPPATPEHPDHSWVAGQGGSSVFGVCWGCPGEGSATFMAGGAPRTPGARVVGWVGRWVRGAQGQIPSCAHHLSSPVVQSSDSCRTRAGGPVASAWPAVRPDPVPPSLCPEVIRSFLGCRLARNSLLSAARPLPPPLPPPPHTGCRYVVLNRPYALLQWAQKATIPEK